MSKLIPIKSKKDKKKKKSEHPGSVVEEGNFGKLKFKMFKRGNIHIFNPSETLLFKKDCESFEAEVDKLDLNNIKEDESKRIEGCGENDTLIFSCIGMRDHYIQINALLLRPDLLVFLQPDTIMMEELRISPLPTRRFFKYVFLQTRLPEEEVPELNLGPLIKKDPGNVPATGIHFTGPVQLLYDAFNKKARLDRKLRKNRKRYSKYLVPEKTDSLVYPGR